MPFISPIEYLSQRLAAAGCAPADADRVLTAVQRDPDGHRMLACLALDVQAGTIAIEELLDAVEKTAVDSSPSRSTLGIYLCFSADHDFQVCVHTPIISDVGDRYVTLMPIQKFVRLFREYETTPGSTGIAEEIEYLRKFGIEGAEEDSLARPMRGFSRPVTWISQLELLDSQIRSAAVNADPSELVEQLGLPWEPITTQHVVALYYPEGQPAQIPIGQPNSRCETWEDPGIFVTARRATHGWGQTCGRCRDDHSGLPERVHGPIDAGPLPAPFRSVYLGSVSLLPLDRRIAETAALKRWYDL